MKRILLIFSLLLFSVSVFATETYTFDPDHTFIVWSVNHFGFSEVSGKFIANGTLLFDAAKPQNSKVTLTVRPDSLATGIAKLDGKMMGRSFFNLKQYPTVTFVSDKVTVTGKNTGKVFGTLTIRNIAKPIVLDVKLNKEGEHPIYHKKTLGFTANATVNRSEFGMRAYVPGVVATNCSLHL